MIPPPLPVDGCKGEVFRAYSCSTSLRSPEPASGLVPPGNDQGQGAVISPCGLFRYRLERRAPEPNYNANTVIIMVNPSTADAEKDDATIRKLKGFGARRGWSNLIVGNLFAYRATNVRDLATAPDPVGPENDAYLRAMIHDPATLRLIFAWGPMNKLPKRLRARWRTVWEMARCRTPFNPGEPAVFSIGAPAKDGHPCHPLLLPYERQLQPWRPAL